MIIHPNIVLKIPCDLPFLKGRLTEWVPNVLAVIPVGNVSLIDHMVQNEEIVFPVFFNFDFFSMVVMKPFRLLKLY